jgi:hypothetical protein
VTTSTRFLDTRLCSQVGGAHWCCNRGCWAISDCSGAMGAMRVHFAAAPFAAFLQSNQPYMCFSALQEPFCRPCVATSSRQPTKQQD